MRLEQIDHIALRCVSPEATKQWYIDTLGFEHVFPGQWSGVPIFIRLGSTCIALFPRKNDGEKATGGAFSHFALRAATRADFESAQDDLRARGIDFEFEDHEVSHSIYFRDPDGVQLEITTYDVPADRH
ncbi:MAG TPA: VOC family protein [Chthoniobacterales bacterium]|jgi:catechol 2,3-dioxygenase-like lactoylglutathione lyase family enzyme|nr:VOC family protein [Chthoniobacterales bacterium]